jgi:hypothetical protein
MLQNSQRARRRVAALIDSTRSLEGMASDIIGELGVEPHWGYEGVHWPNTLERFSTQDFLDLFTVACKFLDKQRRSGRGYDASAKERFLSEAKRIFAEEHLCYEIDSGGGVHFNIDAEFAANTNAAIAALGDRRYANARAQFERAMAALSQANIDGKQGIRGVFNAAECVFKLMYQRAPKLASAGAIGALQPTVQKLYGADATALRAANKSINAFGDWSMPATNIDTNRVWKSCRNRRSTLRCN